MEVNIEHNNVEFRGIRGELARGMLRDDALPVLMKLSPFERAVLLIKNSLRVDKDKHISFCRFRDPTDGNVLYGFSYPQGHRRALRLYRSTS